MNSTIEAIARHRMLGVMSEIGMDPPSTMNGFWDHFTDLDVSVSHAIATEIWSERGGITRPEQAHAIFLRFAPEDHPQNVPFYQLPDDVQWAETVGLAAALGYGARIDPDFDQARCTNVQLQQFIFWSMSGTALMGRTAERDAAKKLQAIVESHSA